MLLINTRLLRQMLLVKALVPFWPATGQMGFSFVLIMACFGAVLVSCLPVIGRHRPLWLFFLPVMGFAFSGIIQRLLWARVRHG